MSLSLLSLIPSKDASYHGDVSNLHKDIKAHEYEEEKLPTLKYELKDATAHPVKFIKGRASRIWEQYGLAEQVMATSIAIFLFDALVLESAN